MKSTVKGIYLEFVSYDSSISVCIDSVRLFLTFKKVNMKSTCSSSALCTFKGLSLPDKAADR